MQAPSQVDVLHGSKRAWNYPHLMPNPHLCPLPSLIAHFANFKILWKSPTLRPPLTSSPFLTSSSGLYRPESSSSTTAMLPFSIFPGASKPCPASTLKIAAFFTRIPDLTRQAPEACSQPCCRNTPTAYQANRIEFPALFKQRRTFFLIPMKMQFIYKEYLCRNKSRWCSSALISSFRHVSGHLFQRHFACYDHLVILCYVRVRTQNLLCVYFQQR